MPWVCSVQAESSISWEAKSDIFSLLYYGASQPLVMRLCKVHSASLLRGLHGDLPNPKIFQPPLNRQPNGSLKRSVHLPQAFSIRVPTSVLLLHHCPCRLLLLNGDGSGLLSLQ